MYTVLDAGHETKHFVLRHLVEATLELNVVVAFIIEVRVTIPRPHNLISRCYGNGPLSGSSAKCLPLMSSYWKAHPHERRVAK